MRLGCRNRTQLTDESRNPVYEDSHHTAVSTGDTFTGVPVCEGVLEGISTKFHVSSEVLADALREIERNSELLDTGTLFSDFDPTPLGANESGHLYLAADAAVCWDIVADNIGLTKTGREAVAAAHDQQVRQTVEYSNRAGDLGIVVSCPDFPPSVIPDIHTLLDKTSLSARRATIQALRHRGMTPAAIAKTLEIGTRTVDLEIAAIDRETRRVANATRTLDYPRSGLTRLEPRPMSDEWLGLEWTPWLDLRDREGLLERLPRTPGVYRVRHSDVSRLLYLGESGSVDGLRDRVGHGLALGLEGDTPPENSNHSVSDPLWQLVDEIGGSVSVSVADPPSAADRRHRLALEAALVAVHRRETGQTPSLMLNRSLPIDRIRRKGTLDQVFKVADESFAVPDWRSSRTVTDPNWMGLEWTDARPLTERGEIDEFGPSVVRVWRPQGNVNKWERELSLVGTTEAPRNRLFNLHREYGDRYLFSVAELNELSSDDIARSREMEEIRYDLVGAHYLVTGRPPIDQF